MGKLKADFFLDKEQSAIQKIVNELDSCLLMHTVKKTDPLIEKEISLIQQLESNEKFMQNELNRQYVLWGKAAVATNKKEGLESILAMLLEALKISIPEYCERYIEDYYLSKQDLRIINLIAAVYSNNERFDEAVNIWYPLKNNIDKHCIDKNLLGSYYPNIIYNLSRALYLLNRHDEVVKLCDKGMQVCRDTQYLFYLPFIAYNKALSLCELGDKESSEKICWEVYHTLGLYQRYDERELIKNIYPNVKGPAFPGG